MKTALVGQTKEEPKHQKKQKTIQTNCLKMEKPHGKQRKTKTSN